MSSLFQWNKDCHSLIDRSTSDVQEKLSQLKSDTVCASGQLLSEHLCRSNSPFDQLCKQLVNADGNEKRMEAIFTSMFNLEGQVDKELCELNTERASSDCKPSMGAANCQDKCDCCVTSLTAKKTSDLATIVRLLCGEPRRGQ